MKIFRELRVRGEASALDEMERRLRSGAAWPNRDELQDNLPGASKREYVVFASQVGGRDRATLWLVRDNGSARIANIVPADGQPTVEKQEYNEIVLKFSSEVLKPVVDALSLKLEVGPDSVGIDDLVDTPVADALRKFSRAANKSTGSAHPSDAERWDDFVIAAHAMRARLTSDELQQWLVEDESWPIDQANELAIEFEQARRLLSRYDESQGR